MPIKTAAEAKPGYWLECGLPGPIAEFVSNLPENKPCPSPHLLRARRIREYWINNPDQEERLAKSWRTIEDKANSTDKLVSLFITWPDKPSINPFPAIFGNRKRGQLTLTPSKERELYEEMATHVDALLRFLGPSEIPRLEWLLTDASATNGEAQTHAAGFQSTRGNLRTSLYHLKMALELADPARKYPTKQPEAKDAALQNYTILLSRLNRYLRQPRHTAIACLANINNPHHPVTADAIKKAYLNLGDKLL